MVRTAFSAVLIAGILVAAIPVQAQQTDYDRWLIFQNPAWVAATGAGMAAMAWACGFRDRNYADDGNKAAILMAYTVLHRIWHLPETANLPPAAIGDDLVFLERLRNSETTASNPTPTECLNISKGDTLNVLDRWIAQWLPK